MKNKIVNTKQQVEQSHLEALKLAAERCPHLRYDETSAIAWATQSDGVSRGVCQRCCTVFSPNRSECVSDYVWKQYNSLSKVPYNRSYDYKFPQADYVVNGVPSKPLAVDWRERVMRYIAKLLYSWTDIHVEQNVKYVGRLNTSALLDFIGRKNANALLRLRTSRLKRIIGVQAEYGDLL